MTNITQETNGLYNPEAYHAVKREVVDFPTFIEMGGMFTRIRLIRGIRFDFEFSYLHGEVDGKEYIVRAPYTGNPGRKTYRSELADYAKELGAKPRQIQNFWDGSIYSII